MSLLSPSNVSPKALSRTILLFTLELLVHQHYSNQLLSSQNITLPTSVKLTIASRVIQVGRVSSNKI